MATNVHAGGGDFPADTVQPVRSHRTLNATFPDAAIRAGSIPMMSSTQWLTGSPNNGAEHSHNQAAYRAKLSGGLFPPNNWQSGMKHCGLPCKVDHTIMIAHIIISGSPGTCL